MNKENEYIGDCFIVNKCQYKPEILIEIKKILKKEGYASIVAEELSNFNVDFLEHTVLGPMTESEFVIVILQPKGGDNKDANFNVAFEYGYARGIGKNVILLFDGEADLLPADIKRDLAIVLKENWQTKVISLIKKEKDERQKKRKDLPENISKLLLRHFERKDYSSFSYLLLRVSGTFNICNNENAKYLIEKSLETSEFGKNQETILNYLTAINNILHYEKSQIGFLIEKLTQTLQMMISYSSSREIIRTTLHILVRISTESCAEIILKFLVEKPTGQLIAVFQGFSWYFESDASMEFCWKLSEIFSNLENEIIFKEIDNEKKELIKTIWTDLTEDIIKKYSRSHNTIVGLSEHSRF